MNSQQMLPLLTIPILVLLQASYTSSRSVFYYPGTFYHSHNHRTPQETEEYLSQQSDEPSGDEQNHVLKDKASSSKQKSSPASDLPQDEPPKLRNKSQKEGQTDRSESKRGLKIRLGINMAAKKSKAEKKNNKTLEEALQKALDSSLAEVIAENGGELPNLPVKHVLKPAYECDEWDPKVRICVLERNLGDTVTFYLSTGNPKSAPRSNVTWKRECHLKNSKTRREIVIDPDRSPNNIIIGRMGFELRVSPITEIDIGYNLFSASLGGGLAPSHTRKLYFMIRIVPIDLGFVYVGETLEIDLRSVVSLPAKSMFFKWYMEKDGEHGTLPSNMKVSTSGSSIRISELRQEQEGIIDCSVYTNRHFFATKKRFLIKDLTKNEDVLKKGPNHSLNFKEFSERKRRNRQPTTIRRFKREGSVDQLIENALMENPTTPNNDVIGDDRGFDQDYNSAGGGGPAPIPPEDRVQAPSNSADSGGQPAGDSPSAADGGSVNENPDAVNGDVDSVVDSPDGGLASDDSGAGNEPADVDSNVDVGPGSNDISNLQSLAADTGLSEAAVDPQDVLMPQGAQNEPQAPPANPPPPASPGHPPQPPKTGLSANQNHQAFEIDIEEADAESPPSGYNRRQRHPSAEEQMAKVLSFCTSDSECSVNAVCVGARKPRQRLAGYCKCLPGYSGVGIFCREDSWSSGDEGDEGFEVEFEPSSPQHRPEAPARRARRRH